MQFTVVVKPWHQEHEPTSGTASSQEQGAVIAGAELDFPVSFLFSRVSAHGSVLPLSRRLSPPQILSRHNLTDLPRGVSPGCHSTWVNAVFVRGRSLLLSCSVGTTSQAYQEVCLLGDSISSSVDNHNWLSHYPFKNHLQLTPSPHPIFPPTLKRWIFKLQLSGPPANFLFCMVPVRM